MRSYRSGVAAVLIAFLAAAALGDEIARANLNILGISLEVDRAPVATGIDIPVAVQTIYGGKKNDDAHSPPDLSVLGDLTGAGLDTPLTLATKPGRQFQIPALHQPGDYVLQNIRLVDRDGRFIQQATPSFAKITVADVLKTSVRVRQLSPDELRARGLNLDARAFDCFQLTMVFAINGQEVIVPYDVIVDKRTHEIITPPAPSDVRLPRPPIAGPPPRFQPPDVFTGVITEDIDSSGAPPAGAPSGDGGITRRRPIVPAALVIPAGFGVLHQFFAVVLNVSNNAPAGAAIRLQDVQATLTSPLAMRVAKVTPPVTLGQAVPITDKATGTTFLVAQAEGSAEWSLEALRAGTHTLNVAIRATYSAPDQPNIPLKGNVAASIVVSDPRFQVNFVHPDTVRKAETYTALAFITNGSPTTQTVVVDTRDISPCSTGIYSNNICRVDGDPSPELTIAPGETKTLTYHLQAGLTGHIYAAAANADSGISASVTLAMGVSPSGVPLSPATLILPYYSRFLDPDLVNAQLALFGIGYSLATAPLSPRTALLPRVLRGDVFQRAQDVARAGQRMFISRRDVSRDDPVEDRDPIFHLALDLLGNIERVDRLATSADLREWDELRRLDDNGRKAGAAMAREIERVGLAGGKSISQLVDAFAAATSHRSPYVLAVVHGAPVAGAQRPYATTVTSVSSRTQIALPAEATGGWARSLPYGELTQLNSSTESGEAAIVGRWTESLELTVSAASPTFTIDLIYPDAADGSFLRASLPVTNADSRTPVRIVMERGKPPTITGALIAGSLTSTPVSQTPLQLVAAAQDLHLDDDGHVVSILTNRPVTSADRDRLALTSRVAAAGYEATRRNNPADPNAQVVIPGASLQDDGRVINISFDHALSSNATYTIAVDPLSDVRVNGMTSPASSLAPRIDNNRPGGILYGKVLRGDGSPVANTAVQLTTSERYQFDVTLPSGDFIFEFVPRDIDRNISGNYTLATQAEGKFAQLDGAIRTPGQVQRVVLQFLGRGSVTGTLKYSDGSIAIGTVTAGSSIYNEFHQVGTDALGVFNVRDLPVGPITLAATDAKGNVTYAATQIHAPGEVVKHDLVFQKRDLAGFATVRVTVRRSDTSAPVAGARVGVYTQGCGLLDGHTDGNGRFEFARVPAGFVSLLASEFNLTRESAGIDFDLRADSVFEQVLTLHVPVPGDPQFVTLHGTVWRDDPAAPNDRTRDQLVPDAVVTIRGLAAVTADSHGEYSCPSVPVTLSDKKVLSVFDPATGRQGTFALPTLQAGATNELKLLLQTTAPRGTATIRVRLLNAAGTTVSDHRVISPGFPADVFTAKGNGVYELNVTVPQALTVWAVPSGRHPIYGDQFARGTVSADFDGQVSVVELRLPGQGTVLAKILIRKPCPNGQTSCAEDYDVAQGTVGIGYPVWDEAEQQLSMSTRSIATDAASGVAVITQVPVGQQPLVETVDHPAGYASVAVATAFDGDTRQVELKLSQLGTVSGRVFSFDGQTPIAGASVRLSGSAANLGPVITAADGAFRFAGVAANQPFRIKAEISQDGIFRTGFVDAASPRFGGPVSGLAVILRQQGSIDGTIVDANGVAVPLAHYWGRELSWPNRTFGSPTDPLIAGTDGHFFLNNLFSGGVRVSAASPAHQEDRGDWQGEIKFENDNQTRVILQVGSGGSGSVSVTVVDPANAFQRVPLAEVTLLRGGVGFDFGITDQNGVAVFENVPAGNFDYSIRATSKRVGRSGSSETFRLARDAIVPTQIVLDLLGRVAGTLVDGDLTPSPPVKGAPVLLTSGALNSASSTGNGGDFLFDGIPEGTFHLDAIDPDSGRHAFSSGDLFISRLFPERNGIQLSLEKTARISVKVYLPDDAGNAGALAPIADVKVSQGGTPYVRELQGNNLTFAKMFSRFGYHIEAKEMGGEERSVRYDGTFAAGAPDGQVVLVFPTSGTVRVQVTADDPALIANARVTINSRDKGATLFTDAAGNAAASGLALGPISVQVTSASLSASANGTLQSHATPLVLTVKLGNRASVDGYVDAEEGGPSSGTRVFIEVSSALLSGLLRLDTRTDANGHFVFAGIPISNTRVTLTMLGPDDATTGAIIRDQLLPDSATGIVSMPRVKLDATRPRVVSIDPPNNANSVSPNTNVIVTFSEPLSAAFVAPSFIQLVATDTNTQAAATVTSEVVSGQFRIRVTPSGLLKSNVVYRVSVSGSIQDLAGHTLIAPVGSCFTSVNYTEPRVIRIDPPVELPIAEGTSFRLEFNKAIDSASFQNGAVAKLEQLDTLHGLATAAIPIQVFLDPTYAATLVIAPTGVAIQPSAFYRVTVNGVRDRQSPPNIQNAAQSFDFFSFDHVKPIVSILSPVPAGFPLISNVAYSASVKITDDGIVTSKDVQYVDWFDSDGATDRFLVRTKVAPFAYNFAAPRTTTGTTFTLKASATDFSNNTSDLATFTWNIAPNNPPAAVTVTPTPASAYLTGHVDVAVAFADEGLTATIALKAVGVHLDGSPYELPISNQQVTRAAVDAAWPAVHFGVDLPRDLKEGDALHVTATVTDSINQAASAAADVAVLTDSTPPRIVSISPASETHVKFGTNYRIVLIANDSESGIAHVTFAYDNKLVDLTYGALNTFSTDAVVTAKNADTRIHIVATAYDFHGNSTAATTDVIYDGLSDGTVPVAQWLTPLDGAALPAGQSMPVKLRVHATDDVHIESVQFESNAFVSPVAPVTSPDANGVYERIATINVPANGSFVVSATVSDANPAHNVVLPITIDAVSVDQQILADAAITASNAAQYANRSLLVSGASTRLYVTVPIALRNLIVLDGAKISNPDRVKLDVTVSDRLYVDGDSSIDVTSKGYLGGWARSEDGVTQNNDARGMSSGVGPLDASGSHAGLGGGISPNAAYGLMTQPMDFGAGGAGGATCCVAGANGGGAIALHAGIDPSDLGRIVIAGAVRADGGSGIGVRYAGAGGSVALSSRALIASPATRITANGGDDDAVANGDSGAGGGRVAVSVVERLDLFDPAVELQARGGRNGTSAEGRSYLDGGAGTVLLRRPNMTSAELIVSSFDERYPTSTHLTRSTPLTGSLMFDAITIGPRALARFDSDYVAPLIKVDPTAVVLAASDRPTILLTPAPPAGASLIQDTSFSATYTASSIAGVGAIALTFISSGVASFSDYPASVPATQASFAVPADAPTGAATLRAVVTDRAGRTAEAAANFTVTANAPPVIDHFDVSPLQIYAGHTAVANVTASDDVGVRSVGLSASSGTISSSPPAVTGKSMSQTFSIALAPSLPGGTIVQLTATASDGFPGRAATTQNATVTVLADSIPPAVTITAPAANAAFDVSSLVRIPIRATAIDAEVGVTQVWASIDGGPAIAMTPDTTAGNAWMVDVPVPSVDGLEPVIKSIVVFAKDYGGNTGQSAPRSIRIQPVVDPNGPAIGWLCPSAGALFPSGYAAKVRVSVVPASQDNDVVSVNFFVGDSTSALAATSVGNNIWEATLALPSGSEGMAVPLKAVATSIRNNVATLQRTVALANGSVIGSDMTIAAGTATYENVTLIVTGGTVTIDGHHTFARLLVLDGAVVTHSIMGSLDVQITGITYISCGGSIDASGRGYQDAASGGAAGAGGSHGGQGGGAALAPFGSTFDPKERGGVGVQAPNCAPCDGTGGGIIRLRPQSLIVDGTLAANGKGTQAGGAGGSIRIDATQVAGSGTITTNGAAAPASGGGGRIAIYFAGLTLPRANLSATGAAAGTLYLKSSSQPFGDLIVDNKGLATTGKSGLTGVGISTTTSSTANTITDTSGQFAAPDVLIGVHLISGSDTSRSWPIVANDSKTITISPDAAFIPQTGALFRGLYRFDSVMIRNANLETVDLLQVGAPIDKDPGSTLVTGNLGPPIVSSALISIAPSALGFAVVGRAGAAIDPDKPVTATARNSRTGALFTTVAANDGAFSVSISGNVNDAFTLTAKDSHRFPLESAPVNAGTLTGATPAASQVPSTGWGVDSNFISRTLSVDGHALAVASYPVGTTGSSDRLVVLDVTNPNAPVVRRTVATSIGAIRDVVVQNGWAYIVGDRFVTVNLDVANASPNATSDPCGHENAVAISGGYAFTADADCASNGTIYVYDVTNPAAPRLLNGQAIGGLTAHNFTDLQVLGTDYLIGISPSASGRDVVIIDKRDVNALKKVSELQIANFDGFRGVVNGTKLYVVSQTAQQLVVVDLQNAAAPAIAGTLQLSAAAGGAAVIDKDLLIADGGAGLLSSSADSALLSINGSVATGGNAFDVAVFGNTAYVANGTGIAIVSVGVAPAIDRSRISVAATGTVTGTADSIRGQVPITVEIKNTATSIAKTTSVAQDGSFSATISAHAGEAITVTATDGAGRVAGPVGVGSVPFGSAARTTPVVISGDTNFRARTIAVDGTTVALAGYPDPTGSIGSSDKLAIYDVSNPSAPVLRRTVPATQGAIRDVVVQGSW
ncbi:MAG: Ig-like domain-containing protein, partial [Acidobacteriota bacterium]|nr:Ig-like domain-containing protein [Acidobacteriota bacterium]